MQPVHKVLVEFWASNWSKSALVCYHGQSWKPKLFSGILLCPTHYKNIIVMEIILLCLAHARINGGSYHGDTVESI